MISFSPDFLFFNLNTMATDTPGGASREEILAAYSETSALGLATGNLRMDRGLVVSEGPLTGKETIVVGPMTLEIAQLALAKHDELIEASIPQPPVAREHIMRILAAAEEAGSDLKKATPARVNRELTQLGDPKPRH